MSTFLSIAECAAEVKVHPWTIWRLCRGGILESIRVGASPDSGPYRIPREAWEEFKRTRRILPPTRPALVARDGELLIDRVLGSGQ